MRSDNFTINQAVTIATQKLIQTNVTNPRFEAKLLMQYCINQKLTFLLSHGSDLLQNENQKKYFEWVQRRELGEPVAYIVGETGFWNLELLCNNSTLIPRADTEAMIEWALALNLPSEAKVLDLGTGTGAIALALASERPSWSVTGVDVIKEAVELAKCNAKKNKIEAHFEQSNWFASLGEQKFDLIVSNPPYVDEKSPYLTQGDLRFEPNTALISEKGGIADLEYILKRASQYLNDNGWLLIEHGYDQAHKVQSEFKKNEYTQIETRKDLNDLDRVSGGCRSIH